MRMSRREVLQTSAMIAAAGSMALPAIAAAAAPKTATIAAKTPFLNLPPQTPISLRADAYGETALLLSRLAAMTTRCEIDVRYGKDPAHRLDIYLPTGAAPVPLPVFINIHGGGWSHGYKEWLGLNAPAIVRFPAIYISIEYSLAPTSKHPKPLHDCLLALAWTIQNVARYGGDPQRIHVGGHSAGAHLAALMTLRRDLHAQFNVPENAIKSCFAYNGLYDFRDLSVYGQVDGKNPGDKLIARREDAADASPIVFAAGNTTPFYVTWAENDNNLTKFQGPALITALRAAAGRAEGYMFPILDHFWSHIDQQRETNVWTRTLKAWMTGDPKTAAMPPA